MYRGLFSPLILNMPKLNLKTDPWKGEIKRYNVSHLFFYPNKASTVDMPGHLNDTIWFSDEWDLEKGTSESSLNVNREICTRSHAYPSKYHSEGLTWLLWRWAAPSTCGVCVLCHKLDNWFVALFIFRFEWHSGEFFQLSRSHLYSVPSLRSCRCERGGEGSRGTVAFEKGDNITQHFYPGKTEQP